MSSHKTLAVIGASDETVAHLRLLMKLGANRLDHQWSWGSEEAADFVAVEVHDLGCQGVIARCQAAGVPVAVMAEPNEVVVHGMVLRRPFKLDQIVAVLNAAGAASATAGPVEAFADDFYTRDLESEIPPGGSDSDDLWTRRERPQASESLHRHPPAQQPAADLDFLIHGDPLVEPEKPKPLITPGTTFDAGDGKQTRSFMYIDDCLKGTKAILNSEILEPINLGSSELVTINGLVDIVEDIAGIKLKRTYKLDAPKGVNGRNSDNTIIKKYLGWEPSIRLRDGMERTYRWIYDEILKEQPATKKTTVTIA